MYVALFYYSLLVLLFCGIVSSTCLNAYFVTGRRADLWLLLGYLCYFADAAVVYQDDFVTRSGAYLEQSFYLIGHPYVCAFTGAMSFGCLWLFCCERLHVAGTVRRWLPIGMLAAASLLSYTLIGNVRVREFCYFCAREVFMAFLLARCAAAYASSTGDERSALSRYRTQWMVCAALTACIVAENVLFMLVLDPMRVTSDYLWFFAERNISENALFMWIGANAIMSLSHVMRARAIESASGENAEGYIGRRLPSFAQEHGLTPREREVAGLILRGCDNQNIANELGIAPSTVKVHVHNVMRKCGVENRSDLRHAFWSS